MRVSSPQKLKLSLASLSVLIALCPAVLSPSPVASDMLREVSLPSCRNQNLILFKREPLDTAARVDLDTSREDRQTISAMNASSAKQTRVVQFTGPIRNAWINAVRKTGVDLIGYVPNNAYIVRGDTRALARIAALDAGTESDDARPIRWMGRLPPIEKIDSAYTNEMLTEPTQPSAEVEIELLDSSDSSSAIEFINSTASVNREPRRFLKFVILSVTLRPELLLDIASLDQVLFVGPATHFTIQDERSSQIVAGNLTADDTQPSGPGYTSWLSALGFDSPSDFVIDITDSGLDRGTVTPHHPDFFDSALHSRIAYSLNYATDGVIEDRTGHGTVVASIVAGLGSTTREDGSGYMYGLGVDPAVLLGASRIFDQNGRINAQLSFTAVVSAAYKAGARITNNSWGNSSNDYDSATQEYDSLVRDAQPAVAGNQEMVMVFSDGNAGPGGHVASPATAKNVISVGASENYRPDGFDSCNLDGGGDIGPDGADNALDILRFSSGGPTNDGRAKPDICAPGTHVFGAASTASGFFGQGLCAGPGVYQPPDQSFYTWSSGTSFSAPHISGAASLVRRFFVSRDLLGDNRAPSPAMTKAYLINSATYMTGENAGGNLPGNRQGWGLVDLSRAFDSAKRVLIDQTRLFTESGQTFEVQGSIADRSQPLRVTLAWTDAPGSLVGPALVNDLDLEITVGGITVYQGNNLTGAFSVQGGQPDRLNNVESIYLPPDAIPAGVQGNFTVTVRAANIAGDGVPGNESLLDQDFALVVYNIDSPLNPPPPPPVPVITNVSYVKKVITIAGHDFTGDAQVEINGRVINQIFDFNPAANSLSLRLKRAKLNLTDGNNQIVVIDHGQRSVPFILKL